MIVIADDLSGAAELAGIAFARGYTAEVQREFDVASGAEVIAVDTDSRGLLPDAAAKRVEALTRAVMAARPAWIYKKVDSVLRGNVRVEIDAVLQATGHAQALLIPANPSRGRTIVGGRLLVDGVPLDQTSFRDDPDHPRISAIVAELLGPGDRIDVPDVADSATLRRYADQSHVDTLPAGAADFFTALLDARGAGQGKTAPANAPVSIERPVLLVCGSRAAWTMRQQQFQAAGLPILLVPDPFEDLESHVRRAADELANRGSLAVAIGDDSSHRRAAQELLPRLATVVASLLEVMPVATVLVEGGATAAALARRLAWNRFRVVQSAPAGVGVLQPLESAPAPTFLIKPGSYAWPEEIWRRLQ
jgi:uncharacterized protein YgbK (DUF1537 family)